MNTEPGRTASSRWVRGLATNEPGPAEHERVVLAEVLKAMRRVRHGTVTLSVQDGKVVQLDITEKRRF